jgi:D-serine deaminase-like pyridoxal phosphate-dependent protein
MNSYEVDTPAAIIDLDRAENNIRKMQQRCDTLGLTLRPHVTAHNIPDIGRIQRDMGGQGIACQTLAEAERFAAEGFNDILIPYNIVGESKTRRLVDLAIYNRTTVIADHPIVIAELADAAKADDMVIRVMIELATAIERTGAKPDEVVTLTERIEKDENLHFAGLFLYPADPRVKPILEQAIMLLDGAGIGVDTVIGAGTDAIRHAAELPEVTEFCAGTYALNDWTMVTRHLADMDDCALLIAATVISRPTTDRLILDCGSRALGLHTAEGGHGYIMEYPCAYIYQLSAEHAHVDMTHCPDKPVIGERVHLIPVRAHAAMSLQKNVHGARNGVIESTWTMP